MLFFLYLFLIGIFAGLLGSVIGIGGGIIIVPLLSLVLKIPIHPAIGTSIISVMATSLAASIRFLKKDIINIPAGLALEIPTTIGGIIGSLTVAYLKNNVLFIIFGCFTVASGLFTFLRNRIGRKSSEEKTSWAAASLFDSEYYDEASGKNIKYSVKNFPLGSVMSFFAGIFSGLLGVGGGILKVPAMNVVMNIPLKVATATSSYMIGITAVVSSFIYFYNGYINPVITIPVIAGVLIGALAGSYTAIKLKGIYLSYIILTVFIVIGTVMFLRAFNILSY